MTDRTVTRAKHTRAKRWNTVRRRKKRTVIFVVVSIVVFHIASNGFVEQHVVKVVAYLVAGVAPEPLMTIRIHSWESSHNAHYPIFLHHAHRHTKTHTHTHTHTQRTHKHTHEHTHTHTHTQRQQTLLWNMCIIYKGRSMCVTTITTTSTFCKHRNQHENIMWQTDAKNIGNGGNQLSERTYSNIIRNIGEYTCVWLVCRNQT